MVHVDQTGLYHQLSSQSTDTTKARYLQIFHAVFCPLEPSWAQHYLYDKVRPTNTLFARNNQNPSVIAALSNVLIYFRCLVEKMYIVPETNYECTLLSPPNMLHPDILVIIHSNTSHWLINSQWWIWLVEPAVKSSKSSSSCCQYKTSLFLWILKWCSPSKPFSRINCFRYILQAATNFPLTLIRVLLTKSFVWCKIRNKTVFVQRKEIRFVPNFNELIFWFDSMTWHSTLPTESRFDSFIMNFYWQTVSIIRGLWRSNNFQYVL